MKKISGFAAGFFVAAAGLGLLMSSDAEMREPVAYVMLGVLVTIGVVVAWLESWKR